MNDLAFTQSPGDTRIAAFRRFNRFYTQKIGVLERGYLQSPFSLAEARVLYELGQRGETTASEISARLGLDMGQPDSGQTTGTTAHPQSSGRARRPPAAHSSNA